MTIDGPVGAHAIREGETGPSDLELVQRTRDGDSRAFGELWNRHSRAGRTVARSYALDPDDVVAESFAKVLQAIKNGGGPTAAFRPYLFSTIRNVAMQWRKASIVDASDELDALADPSSEDSETLLALDKSLTAQAFRSLPTRWQEALWYSEVEQLSSQEISPLLGMTPNAVSALTFRAREGLRQAWIQAHLVRSADTECAAIIEKLGSYTRGSLGPRESKRVEMHLAGCPSCTIVEEEARDIGSRLTLVLLPLAAGIAGALAYIVWLQGGASASAAPLAAASAAAPRMLDPLSSHSLGSRPAAAHSPVGELPGSAHSPVGEPPDGAPEPHAVSHAGPGWGHVAVATPDRVAAAMPSNGALAVIGVAVAAAIGAAFVLGPLTSRAPVSPVAQAEGVASTGQRIFDGDKSYGAHKASASVVPAGSPAGTSSAASGSGTSTAGSSVGHSSSAAGSNRGSTDGGGTTTTRDGGSAAGSPAPGGTADSPGTTTTPGSPGAAPDPTPSTTPDPPATSTPTPTPPPTNPPPTDPPPTSPPPTSPPTAPATPQARFTVDPGNRLYPLLNGTADPGATVQVIDAAGSQQPAGVASAVAGAQPAAAPTVVAQTVADSTGAYGLSDFPSLGFGLHQLSVRQVDGAGVASALSAPTTVMLDQIRILSPMTGSTLDDLGYLVAASGDPQAFFDVLANGVSAGVTGLQLNSDGNASVQLTLPTSTSPGDVTIALRYLDPSTGRFGPAASVTVAFDPAE